ATSYRYSVLSSPGRVSLSPPLENIAGRANLFLLWGFGLHFSQGQSDQSVRFERRRRLLGNHRKGARLIAGFHARLHEALQGNAFPDVLFDLGQGLQCSLRISGFRLSRGERRGEERRGGKAGRKGVRNLFWLQ